MLFLFALVFSLWMATLFGKPNTPPPSVPLAPPTPQWRCTLRNKKTVTVEAVTEADAMRALIDQKVDITRIDVLEKIA